ncbi:ankyrin repeat domain-containing protein [Pseudomonas sp. NPDC089406]|uniref:ankyrin repeat domain-containing protein n=1 Tax=Pseudomonas sp. NPDC089406 TaxID=3364463 RepID=UPI00384E1087
MSNAATAVWNARVAIEQHDLGQLQQILAPQPELATLSINTEPGYRSLMHIAAASGNLEACLYLRELGVAVDAAARREARATPLGEAAASGQLATVTWLMQQGARVDGAPEAVANPLLNAVRFGHLSVAEQLLQAGADVNRLHANLHQTPLDLAKVWKHVELQQLLQRSGAQAMLDNSIDWSTQHLGAIGHYVSQTAGPVLPIAYCHDVQGHAVQLRLANVENKWRYKLLFTLGLADFEPRTELFFCLTDNWPVSASAAQSGAPLSFPMKLLLSLAGHVVGGASIEEGLVLTTQSELASTLAWPKGIGAVVVVDYVWNPQGAADSEAISDPVKLLMLVPVADSKLGSIATAAKLAKFVETKRSARWNAIALPFEA